MILNRAHRHFPAGNVLSVTVREGYDEMGSLIHIDAVSPSLLIKLYHIDVLPDDEAELSVPLYVILLTEDRKHVSDLTGQKLSPGDRRIGIGIEGSAYVLKLLGETLCHEVGSDSDKHLAHPVFFQAYDALGQDSDAFFPVKINIVHPFYLG